MASMSKTKRVYGHHDPELIKDDVHEIKTKKMSIKQAAKHVRLLLSTLCNKKRDKRPVVYTNRTLNQAEKNRLAQWRINLRKHGFGNSYKEIVEIVPDILAAKNLSHSPETIIKKPSRQWLSGFYRQHPEFSIRTSKACGRETVVSSTPKKFEKWFSNFIKCMNQSDPTILSSSNKIFVPDERGFSFDPKSREVVANKRSTHVTSNTMTLATVLACLSDAAQYTAPLLIYPCKRNPQQNLLEDLPEALLQVSSDDCVPSECLRIDLNVRVEGKSFRFNQVLTNALHHFHKELSNKIEYRFEKVEEINLSAEMFDEFLSTVQWYCAAKSHLWKLEHLLELWDAARVLNIVHLIRTCERKVGRIISGENFETVYAKANLYKSEIVLYKARSFLQRVWLDENFEMSLTHVLSYAEFYHLIKYRPNNNYGPIGGEDIILRSTFEWVENFEKQVGNREEISQELVKLSQDKRENGDRDSFLEDKLEESSKLSRLLKASKYNFASIECLKELSIHQLCKKDREAELILTKAISFKLDRNTHGYWPPGAFERNKVGYRHIGVLADEDRVSAMLLEEDYFCWMEAPRCPLHSKIKNLTVFDNELYTVSSSGLESLIFVYRNKEWKFVLDLPNKDFVVLSKGEFIYAIDCTSSSVKCVSPRETPVLYSEIKFPDTMRSPESALDFDKSILNFCSTDSDEKSAVFCLDVPEHKWTDCGRLEGSAKNLVGFRNETNYFILQRDGTISQVLRNQDDSIEFTVIKRLWSIQSALQGAFIYSDMLYIFSNTPMESSCLCGVSGVFSKIEYWYQEQEACDFVQFFLPMLDICQSESIYDSDYDYDDESDN